MVIRAKRRARGRVGWAAEALSPTLHSYGDGARAQRLGKEKKKKNRRCQRWSLSEGEGG